MSKALRQPQTHFWVVSKRGWSFGTQGREDKTVQREHEFRGPDSTNHQGKLFKRKGIWKRCLGGAHRVHFEHSLLHDSVTTIRVAPG